MKKRSPSLKVSCPVCGKKVFDVRGHRSRDKKCRAILKSPIAKKISPVSPGSSTPINTVRKKIKSFPKILSYSPVSSKNSKRSSSSSFPSPISSPLKVNLFSPKKSPILAPLKQKSPISKKRKSLASGYEINPLTGKKRKSCNNNQVRDPQTGRCRKIRSSKKKSLKTKSPVKSPIRKTKSPAKSPVRKTKSSVKSLVRKTKSPVKSPVRKTKSPVKSPVRKTKSPVKSPKSKKRTCPICNKQVLNLKQHQKSAKCRRAAGLKKSLSPKKSSSKKSLSPKKSSKKSLSPKKSLPRYGYIFENVRPQISQQNLNNFILPYDESKCTDDCPICLTDNDETDSVILRDCKHCFHLECLRQWWSVSSKCPSCNKVYGYQIGNMPMGTMSARLERYNLQGSRYDTIVIHYDFPPGVTSVNQPNPGTPYPGDVRNCFLEASPEGYEVLELLRRSFERGLTFTIGDSLTTGRRNVIVWNGIHHKTSTSGGSANFGFPDPGYYSRVKDELRAKGIF